jgi:hypothetical protein
MERLEQAADDGHRALVFSQWTGLLDLVEPHLRDRAIDFVRLDGTTRDRAAVVGAFQAEDGPPVMLVSLRAGGTGLNLTSADHIFLLDPWWNPAVEDQAADRAHRIGQTRPVLVHPGAPGPQARAGARGGGGGGPGHPAVAGGSARAARVAGDPRPVTQFWSEPNMVFSKWSPVSAR